MSAAGVAQMQTATRAMTLRWLGRMHAGLALALIVAGAIVAGRRAARLRAASGRLNSRLIDS